MELDDEWSNALLYVVVLGALAVIILVELIALAVMINSSGTCSL